MENTPSCDIRSISAFNHAADAAATRGATVGEFARFCADSIEPISDYHALRAFRAAGLMFDETRNPYVQARVSRWKTAREASRAHERAAISVRIQAERLVSELELQIEAARAAVTSARENSQRATLARANAERLFQRACDASTDADTCAVKWRRAHSGEVVSTGTDAIHLNRTDYVTELRLG